MQSEKNFILQAIAEALLNIDNSGGPFGAVIVFENKIIAKGFNTVVKDYDPTAHAEINAIRNASKFLQRFDLSGCTLYSSCEPCPMCFSAIYWARLDKVFYAATKNDAHEAGFDDQIIFDEIKLQNEYRKIPFININRENALIIFEKWKNKEDKIKY